MFRIASNSSGATQARAAVGGDPGRHRQHHGLAGPSAIGRRRCAGRSTRPSRRCAARRPGGRTARRRRAPAARRGPGSTRLSRQAFAREGRNAGGAAAQQRLAHHRSEQARRPCSGRVFSAAIASGSTRRCRACRGAARRATVASAVGARSRAAARDSRRLGSRHAAPAAKESTTGMRPAFGRTVQRSPLRDVHEREIPARPAPRSVWRAPIAVEIGEGRAIAGQQQVIAVVDAQPSSRSKYDRHRPPACGPAS